MKIFEIDHINKLSTIPQFTAMSKKFVGDDKKYMNELLDKTLRSYIGKFIEPSETFWVYDTDILHDHMIQFLSRKTNLLIDSINDAILLMCYPLANGDDNNLIELLKCHNTINPVFDIADRIIAHINSLSDDDLKCLLKHLVNKGIKQYDKKFLKIGICKFYDVMAVYRPEPLNANGKFLYSRFHTLNNIHITLDDAKQQAFFDRTIRELLPL